MISPHGGDNMLARLEAGVNTFPHISQMKYFCQSFVSFDNTSGKVLEMNSWGYKNSVKAPTIYSMSTLGRPSLSVDFHVHLQVVATRKRFSK